MSDNKYCDELAAALGVPTDQWEHLLADVYRRLAVTDVPTVFHSGDADEPACTRCDATDVVLYSWTLSRDTLCGACVRIRWGRHPCLSSHP